MPTRRMEPRHPCQRGLQLFGTASACAKTPTREDFNSVRALIPPAVRPTESAGAKNSRGRFGARFFVAKRFPLLEAPAHARREDARPDPRVARHAGDDERANAPIDLVTRLLTCPRRGDRPDHRTRRRIHWIGRAKPGCGALGRSDNLGSVLGATARAVIHSLPGALALVRMSLRARPRDPRDVGDLDDPPHASREPVRAILAVHQRDRGNRLRSPSPRSDPIGEPPLLAAAQAPRAEQDPNGDRPARPSWPCEAAALWYRISRAQLSSR